MNILQIALRAIPVTLRWLLMAPWLLVGAARLLPRLPPPLLRRTRCPRGHEVRLHGVWQCACGALFAGHAFQDCPVCGQAAGWTSCDCGLAVRRGP